MYVILFAVVLFKHDLRNILCLLYCNLFQKSGEKKIRLVPSMEVFLSQTKLSQCLHLGSSNPKELMITLMDCIFSREVLARSSAKWTRRAHNAKAQTYALPSAVVAAVKEFVLNEFKKEDGQPCLTDTELITRLINMQLPGELLKCEFY